ncbi:MAG: hypothetical protein M3Z84_06885, partial [Actinomycetota bacterium]|nr:hypothetical protein [Actinomycetota bacterium]
IGATEYSFSGPDTITGGAVRVTLRNTGKKAHEVQLLRIGDTPPDQAIKDFTSVMDSGGPVPAYLGAGGGVAKVNAGSAATGQLQVKPGKYLLVCTITDAASEPGGGGGGGGPGGPPAHFTLGMLKPLTVAGDNGRTLAATGATITAKDYSFDTSGLKAGDNTITFANTGPDQIHEGVLMEFPAGVTEAGAMDAFKALAQSQGPPPPGTPQPTPVGQGAALDPGLREVFSAKLQSGRTYILLCFTSDKTGGPPHAFGHQMAKVFTLS